MQIPLQFSNERIIAVPIIWAKKYRIAPKPQRFIVDTGSPYTLLMQGDAARLGVPLNSLKYSKTTRLGGTKYNLFELSNVQLNFRDEKESLFVMHLEKIYIAQTTRVTDDAKREADSLPSILGIDLMTSQKLTLVFSPHKNEAYFQKEV